MMIKAVTRKIKQNYSYEGKRTLKRYVGDIKSEIPFHLYKKHLRKKGNDSKANE